MIKYIYGNLFNSHAQLLVNPVNTVGVMGKGLALEFKRRYPAMFRRYRQLCNYGHGLLTPGKLWIDWNAGVLCFPTKLNWRDPSRLSYVTSGLADFAEHYRQLGVTSIAFPMLGVGCGGLNWARQVKPAMEYYLGNLPIHVYVYIYR